MTDDILTPAPVCVGKGLERELLEKVQRVLKMMKFECCDGDGFVRLSMYWPHFVRL